MAAAVRQRITTTVTGAAVQTTISWTFTSTPVAGSTLILAFVGGGNSYSPTTPAGWTVRTSNQVATCNLWLFDKVAAGTESTVTLTVTGGGPMLGWLYEVTGLTGTADASGNASATSTTTTACGPTGATTAANEWVLAFSGSDTAAGSAARALTSFTALALGIDVQSNTGTTGSYNCAGAAGFGAPGNASGATLNSTATWNASADDTAIIAGYKVAPVASAKPFMLYPSRVPVLTAATR